MTPQPASAPASPQSDEWDQYKIKVAPTSDEWEQYKVDPSKLPSMSAMSSVPIPGSTQGPGAGISRDTAVDFARPFVAGGLGDLAGGFAAPSGPGALAAYGGTYSLTDALMQYLKANKPSSFVAALGEGALNAGGQKLMNGAVNKLIGVGKGFLNADQPEILKFLPTSSQALKATSSPILGGITKSIEDLAVGAKSAALDRTAGKGFTQALQLAKNNDFTFTRNPQLALDLIGKSDPDLYSFSKVDEVIGDPKKLQATLTSAQTYGVGDNLKKSLQGYQFMKMFQNATTQSLDTTNPMAITRINPQSLANDWFEPKMQDSFKTLYSAQNRSDITQFFKNISMTQDKVNPASFSSRFWLWHAGVGITTGIFTGSVTGGVAASAGSVGILLGAQQVGKLLTNPKTARLMVALAGNEPLGYSEQMAGKILTRALQGTTLSLLNKDGTTVPVRLDSEGKLNPIQ